MQRVLTGGRPYVQSMMGYNRRVCCATEKEDSHAESQWRRESPTRESWNSLSKQEPCASSPLRETPGLLGSLRSLVLHLPAPMQRPERKIFDCLVIGGGHNGLGAAAYLGRAGKTGCGVGRGRILG